MPTRRTPIPADALPKLDAALSTLKREAATSDHDPFDAALIAAVEGVAEAMRAEGRALVEVGRGMRKVGQKAERGAGLSPPAVFGAGSGAMGLL